MILCGHVNSGREFSGYISEIERKERRKYPPPPPWRLGVLNYIQVRVYKIIMWTRKSRRTKTKTKDNSVSLMLLNIIAIKKRYKSQLIERKY